MLMEISFPGGAAVEARFKGHTVRTDQPEKAGGQDTGPAPFDLFLASIGTCTGYYAARYCELKGIDPRQLSLRLTTVRDGERKRLAKVRVEIKLPADFPDKYRNAIVRAADQCAVKRHIIEPPELEVVAVR
jgi:putative redox protein